MQTVTCYFITYNNLVLLPTLSLVVMTTLGMN